MSTIKYFENPDELAHFRRSSLHLKTELNFLLEYGITRLDFGMHQWKNVDNKPSFTYPPIKPPYAYNEKNLYVDASNNLWMKTIWSFPQLDEIYYDTLLKRIKEFETNEKFDFNKGIVYANLGVAQSAQMKIDEGFANILKALIEDSGYSTTSKPQYDLFRRKLFTQSEDRYVKKHLQGMLSQLNMANTSPVEQFVENFLESLNDDQRAFFDYTFARIIQNLEIWKEKENGFTANRLLAYTQDFCLFNEDFLRSRFSQPDPHWLLDDLIREAKFPANVRGCGAFSMTDLDNKLPSELNNQNQPEKCLRILLTLRNYSSHNISGGTSANCFYARYDEIFSELIRAMCYIRLLP